jgi:hypothetical protein
MDTDLLLFCPDNPPFTILSLSLTIFTATAFLYTLTKLDGRMLEKLDTCVSLFSFMMISSYLVINS